MELQGMSDTQYAVILAEVPEIQFLIIQRGRMATKSLVENVLMARYDMDRGDAHTFTNMNESQNDHSFRFSPLTWVSKLPEPGVGKYPELEVIK